MPRFRSSTRIFLTFAAVVLAGPGSDFDREHELHWTWRKQSLIGLRPVQFLFRDLNP